MPTIPQVLLLIETSKAYGRGLLQGIGRYAWTHGPWSVYLEERSLEDRLPPWIKDWHGDGIIVRSNSRAMVKTLLATGRPVVETDPKVTGMGLPFVYSDDRAVARLAAEHFLERGLRHLAWCAITHSRWSELRREAFVAELAGRGLGCEVFELPARLEQANWQDQRESLTAWIERMPRPLGILAENDVCGHRILDACRLLGVSIPEQVAVLGVDNDPVLCRLASPQLSSIDLDVERIGFEAAALLDRLMKGEPAPTEPRYVAPRGVAARTSTDTLAIDVPQVAEALRYIRLHAAEGIDVQDVLRNVPTSRRALEQAFRKSLGRTPKTEIMRVKLNRARELLEQTDLSIRRVAEQAGFSSHNYFANVFQRELGMTPRTYRRQARADESTLSDESEN